MWAIQTAWLGSFPGKDVSYYSLWTYLQFGGGVFLFLCAIVFVALAIREANEAPGEAKS